MIEFFAENVTMPDLDFVKIEKWIERVAESHGYGVGNLTYCFCDDEYILETNRKFLNHDYFTDIITFDYTRPPKRVCNEVASFKGVIGGDMVISLDTVRTNAEGLKVSYTQELLRVIIHGVLHLCGINDKGPGEREIMENEENIALKLF
ncbi:MAG: rRNA maturation RNase YbeY [Muribaculaceae bacterium]|nr:rRNA maturation RNase YbeY [Muribaculaceae bacterium]